MDVPSRSGALAPEVLEILVDPGDKLPLQYLSSLGVLYNERTRMKYIIDDRGIAILLADSAVAVTKDEHEQFMGLLAAGETVTTGTRTTETGTT